MSEKTIDPYNIDGHSFDPDKYLEKVLQVCVNNFLYNTN